MEFFIIYLFNVLDSIRILFQIAVTITIVLLFFLLLLSFICGMESDGKIFIEFFKKYIKYIKYIMTFIIIAATIIVLVPTKENLKWIIGGGIAWKGIAMTGELQGINELPQNVLNATNVFLETIAENDESETQ